MAISDLTNVDALAYDNTGDVLYMVADDNLYTVSKLTGIETLIGSLGVAGVLDMTHDGITLYAIIRIAAGQTRFYSINVSTGLATRLGTQENLGIPVTEDISKAGCVHYQTFGIIRVLFARGTQSWFANFAKATNTVNPGFGSGNVDNTEHEFQLGLEDEDDFITYSNVDDALQNVNVNGFPRTQVGSATQWGASIIEVHAITNDPDDDLFLIIGEIADGTKALYTVNKMTGEAALDAPPVDPVDPVTPVTPGRNYRGDFEPVSFFSGAVYRQYGGLEWDGQTLYGLQVFRFDTDLTPDWRLFSIDRETGDHTQISTEVSLGAPGAGIGEIASEFDGIVWDGTDLRVFTPHDDVLHIVDRDDGNVESAGIVFFDLEVDRLAWDGTTLFAVSDITHALYSIDPLTGVSTRIGEAIEFGVGERIPGGLTWDGLNLLMVGNTNRVLYSIDRVTGVATRIQNVEDFGIPNMTGHPNEGLVGLAWDGTDLFAYGYSNRRRIGERQRYDVGFYRAIFRENQILTESPANELTENTFTIEYEKANTTDAEPTAAIAVDPLGNMANFSVSTPASGELVLTRNPVVSPTDQIFEASDVTVTLTFADGTTDSIVIPFAEHQYETGHITTRSPFGGVYPNNFTVEYVKVNPTDAEPTAAFSVIPSANMSSFSLSVPADGSFVITRDLILSSMTPAFAESDVTITLTFADGLTDDVTITFRRREYVPGYIRTHTPSDPIHDNFFTRPNRENERFRIEYIKANPEDAEPTVSIVVDPPAHATYFSTTTPDAAGLAGGHGVFFLVFQPNLSPTNRMVDASEVTVTVTFVDVVDEIVLPYFSEGYFVPTPRMSGRFEAVGEMNVFGETEGLPTGLAWDGFRLYMVGTLLDRLYVVDQETGQILDSGVPGFGVGEWNPAGLAFDGTNLWMLGHWNNALYTVDRITSIATLVATYEDMGLTDRFPTGIAWDGQSLYVITSSIERRLWRLDSEFNAIRVGHALDFGADETNPQGFTSDLDSLFMVGATRDLVYEIDKTTGVATPITTLVQDFDIPEGAPTAIAWAGNTYYMVGIFAVVLSRAVLLESFITTESPVTPVDANTFTIEYTKALDTDAEPTAAIVVDPSGNMANFSVSTPADGSLTLSRDPMLSVTNLVFIASSVTVSLVFADGGTDDIVVNFAQADYQQGRITTLRPTNPITQNTFNIRYEKVSPNDAEPTAAIVVDPTGNMSNFSVSTPSQGLLVLTRDPMLSATNIEFDASEVTVTLTFADGLTDDLDLRFARALFVATPEPPTLIASPLASGAVRLSWVVGDLNNSVLVGFTIRQGGQGSAMYSVSPVSDTADTPILAPGNYTFSIIARSNAGDSASSNVVSVIVQAGVDVADAPNLSAVLNVDYTVTLRWNIPALNGSVLEGFTITQGGQAGATYTTGAAAIVFTTEVLDPGTYNFSIVANTNLGDSGSTSVRGISIVGPGTASPLPFVSSILVDTDLGTVLAADADDDNVYLLTRSNNVDRIYTADKTGVVTGTPTTIVFNGFNDGLARVGSGFATSYVDARFQTFIEVVDAQGAIDSDIRVGNIDFFPNALVYRASSNDYVLFARDSFAIPSGSFAFTVASDGTVRSRVELFPGSADIDGAAMGPDRFWIVEDPLARNIPHYDLAFNALGSFQTRHPQDVDRISGLAYSQGQLIVVTGSGAGIRLHFYGDTLPDAPSAGRPIRQIAIDSPAFERFDIVRGATSVNRVLALNANAVRATAIELVDVPGTQTLQERLAIVEITPEWTVPLIKQGDKLFLHKGDADLEPTDLPANGVYTIQNIISTGDSYRQVFVCGLDL